MSGRLTHTALRALDRVNRALLPRSKKPEHLLTGRKGEEEAYFYLRQLGYVMVARNWRSPRRKGELDLVGWDGDVLCFVEVKTRTTLEVKPAEAAVDAEKRRELSLVAIEFLRRMNPPAPQHRFDILSIYYLEGCGKSPRFALFKNCFPMA
jgi:putative endonuclease